MSRGFLGLLIVLGLLAAGAGYLRFKLIPEWNEALYNQQIEMEREELERLELTERIAAEQEASMAALYEEAQNYATASATISAEVMEDVE
ncbi:hypothetical protein FWH30_02825 [Microgenomates group bacterium]|nr:hypothetical protein [Microgenomates group bacterium]